MAEKARGSKDALGHEARQRHFLEIHCAASITDAHQLFPADLIFSETHVTFILDGEIFVFQLRGNTMIQVKKLMPNAVTAKEWEATGNNFDSAQAHFTFGSPDKDPVGWQATNVTLKKFGGSALAYHLNRDAFGFSLKVLFDDEVWAEALETWDSHFPEND